MTRKPERPMEGSGRPRAIGCSIRNGGARVKELQRGGAFPLSAGVCVSVCERKRDRGREGGREIDRETDRETERQRDRELACVRTTVQRQRQSVPA
jgi:hypothetical protein